MKKNRFNFYLLLFLFLSVTISYGNTSTGELSTPLPAQYVVRSWLLTGDCLWNIAGQPWVYDDPTMWRHLYEANMNKMPQPDNPDLIHIGMVLEIPSIRGEIREGVWTDSGVQVAQQLVIPPIVRRADPEIFANEYTVTRIIEQTDTRVIEQAITGTAEQTIIETVEQTDTGIVEQTDTGTVEQAAVRTTSVNPAEWEKLSEINGFVFYAPNQNLWNDYHSALDSVILEIPGPGQVQNNRYLLEGIRLTGLAREAFEIGEYDESLRYSEEALLYAQTSDVWVNLQIVINDVMNARNQALAAGAGYYAPSYFLEIDDATLNALNLYESRNYYRAFDSGIQILEMYKALTVGVEAYKIRVEIEERDFFHYDPVNISMADDIAFSALLDYELGNIAEVAVKADDIRSRYSLSLNTARESFAMDWAMAASAEHQRALELRANVVFRQEYDTAYAAYNQGAASFRSRDYDQSASLYMQSRAMFILLIDSLENSNVLASAGAAW